MSQVFANTIDNNPIYAARAEADEDGLNLKQYYAKIADLAAVAFSGSYNDLANTPSIPTKTSDLTNDSGFITASDIPAIPTKTSDLTNDSGFITASDIPAQVNADWNESDPSDPAYIENKPTIPAAQVNSDWNAASGVAQILNKPDMSLYALISSLSTVATSGSYLDLDDLPTIPTKTSDLTNDSGFITLSDVPAQVQADWNESDTSDPAYIQNKPTIPTVPVQDVEYNGTSVVNAQGVAEIPAPSYPVTDVTMDGTSVLNNGVAALTSEVEILAYGSTGAWAKFTAAIAAGKSIFCRVNPSGNNYRFVPLSYYNVSEGKAEFNFHRANPTKNYTTQCDELFVYSLSSSGTWATANKNVAIKYLAGNGMRQTTVANDSITFAVDNPLPASAATDNGKVLTVNSSGNPEWQTGGGGGGGTVDQTYDPTSTNAQSGTAVAGALATVKQVPASTASDSGKILRVGSSGDPEWIEEEGTTLFENSNGITVGGTMTLSESIDNFPYIALINGKGQAYVLELDHFRLSAGRATPCFQYTGAASSSDQEIITASIEFDAAGTSASYVWNNDLRINSSGVLSRTNDVTNATSRIYRIIGLTSVASYSSGGAPQQQANWTQTDSSAVDYIKNKPNLAAVATSGSYNDLSNKPTIPAVWTSGRNSLSKSGSGSNYRYKLNKNAPAYYTGAYDSTNGLRIQEQSDNANYDWDFYCTTKDITGPMIYIYDSSNNLATGYDILFPQYVLVASGKFALDYWNRITTGSVSGYSLPTFGVNIHPHLLLSKRGRVITVQLVD